MRLLQHDSRQCCSTIYPSLSHRFTHNTNGLYINIVSLYAKKGMQCRWCSKSETRLQNLDKECICRKWSVLLTLNVTTFMKVELHGKNSANYVCFLPEKCMKKQLFLQTKPGEVFRLPDCTHIYLFFSPQRNTML